MASNPMQKKSRNAFLTGMLIMLIIAAIAMVTMFIIMRNNNNKQQEEQAAGQTYVYRLNTSVKSGEEIDSSKVTSVLVNIEAVPSGAVASKTKIESESGEISWKDKAFDYDGFRSKIDLDAGTILSESMLYEEELQNSERIQEYNMLQLPIQLDIGEYVDIRLLMSNGQDYIVVSHKEVKDITDETIWLQLTEEEILIMSNAIVESYLSPASNLYVTKYVEPGIQGAANITYVPSAQVIELIREDSNIINQAKTTLIQRYNDNQGLRGNIQDELDKYSEEATENIESQMLEEREKAREAREEFLHGVE